MTTPANGKEFDLSAVGGQESETYSTWQPVPPCVRNRTHRPSRIFFFDFEDEERLIKLRSSPA